jgi:hypothetical protein
VIRAADKLALRGKSKEQLVALAGRYLLAEDLQGADRIRLIEALSRAASTNEPRSEEVGADRAYGVFEVRLQLEGLFMVCALGGPEH